MILCETPRLRIEPFTTDDASFVLALVNERGFLQWIGDKNIRTRADARYYLQKGPMEDYRIYGHGLYKIVCRATEQAVGICGILRRMALHQPDVGYALLENWQGRGLAQEAVKAVLQHAREDLKEPVIAAVVTPENKRSIHLLEKSGFHPSGTVQLEENGRSWLLYQTQDPDAPFSPQE